MSDPRKILIDLDDEDRGARRDAEEIERIREEIDKNADDDKANDDDSESE